MLKNPGFTTVAVVTLALGIAVNATIFSVVKTTLDLNFPIKDQNRIASLWSTYVQYGWGRNPVSLADFLDWRQQNTGFEGLAAVSDTTYLLTGGEPLRVLGQRVTANFFDLLGVQPALGRTFLPQEDRPGAAPVVVLSHGLWRRHFGADPGVVGGNALINDESHTVIGIMPANFWFRAKGVELWTTLIPAPQDAERSRRSLHVVGRIRPNIQLKQARAEMDGVARRLGLEYPRTNAGWGISIVPLTEDISKRAAQAMGLLLLPVFFVLVIVCANVANLILTRSSVRRTEIAIRAALGAGRVRLVRQLLTESLLLAFLGAALGLLLTFWGTSLLGTQLSRVSPVSAAEFRLDAPVFGFALLLALLTPLLFGLAPALHASRIDLAEALRAAGKGSWIGRRTWRARDLLVVAEVALVTLLLVPTGLFLRSMIVLERLDPGFDPENLLTIELALSNSEYPGDANTRVFYRSVLERIAGIPGVQAAGAANRLPGFGGRRAARPIVTEEAATEETGAPLAIATTISPGYFDTIGVSLLAGRNFSDADSPGAPHVAVVSETMVRRCWPGQDPLGRRFKIESSSSGSPWITVVGVVAEIQNDDPRAGPLPQVYFPHAQKPERRMTILVRTLGAPEGMISATKGAVWAVDKKRPIDQIQTMRQVLSGPVAQGFFVVGMLGVFAALALILGAVGVYGVVSYWVAQRTHEIGVRVALGARRSQILTLVILQGMLPGLVGLGLGLLAAAGITRLLSHELVGVTAADPLTFASASLVALLACLFACYVPARRATRVDPMVAIRCD